MTRSDIRQEQDVKASSFERLVFRAVIRAYIPIVTVAVTYTVAMLVGITMVHAGSKYALERRDHLFVHVQQQDKADIAFREDERLKAVAIEVGRDAWRALRATLEALTIVIPYPTAAYNGWYRGILSVDGGHASRLAHPIEAAYFLGYQMIQITAFSLASGAGINLTLACLRPRPYYRGDKIFILPKEALRDLLRLYVLVLPLLLLATWWEYFLA